MKKGFSLPVFVVGAAKTAVKKLVGFSFEDYELIKIPNENKDIKIKVHSSGFINGKKNALGIVFVESSLNLDLTQNLEIWTIVSLEKFFIKKENQRVQINIIPGYGVGIDQKTEKICMSNFAREILHENLIDLVPDGFKLNLEIIFPQGKFLAERTSNKSFGIVEGLSIIGTSAETYTSASPEQLKDAKLQLEEIVKKNFCGIITFVIGENGLDIANKCNMQFPILKVGNWIGPLLVHAAIKKIQTVIILGYHGKLIKLAGGVFHTHNHIADARIEILVYLAVKQNVPIAIINQLSQVSTVEDALLILESFSTSLANDLWSQLSNSVERRSIEYVKRYTKTDMKIASLIFDRKRKVRWSGTNGRDFLQLFKENQ